MVRPFTGTYGCLAFTAALSGCATPDRDDSTHGNATSAAESAPAEATSGRERPFEGDAGTGSSTTGDSTDWPGEPTTPALPPEQQAELDAWLELIAAAAAMTTESFLQQYLVPFAKRIDYDPLTAANLDLIQASPLALDGEELAILSQRGFVITDKMPLHNFAHGYHSVYVNDLPVYISADSILYAFHRSYDRLLMKVERQALIPELETLLTDMRTALGSGAGISLGETARADADLFSSVALRLLTGTLAAPVAGADPDEIAGLVLQAETAEGIATLDLFGAPRIIDFSQFDPRGHYLEDIQLSRYFRCMMWLGRIDLRILEAQPNRTLLFHRRQLEGAYVLRETLNAESLERWVRIDDTLGAFVGEPGYMTVPQLDGLSTDLDLGDPGDITTAAASTIAQAIYDGRYGTQRISSHVMINGILNGTMPLSSSFGFLGQRYVVDSHVFSNLVFDRVQGGTKFRMMPDPLEVGFAALANDHAGLLLADELNAWSYAPDLHVMRALVDAHPESFWHDNLYNLWLSAIRTLSPGEIAAGPTASDLPSVARTEAWGRRLLNTQAASWAELRHDTLLYAKPSYTTGAGCEYPDAYVDPYPRFFAALERLADKGQEVVAGLDLITASDLAVEAGGYFAELEEIAAILRGIAENELAGLPLTSQQLAFINDAVTLEWGCVPDADRGEGWYINLFYDDADALNFDPTIVDVHTQPTDSDGAEVGRVLHVATGRARPMVVTVDGCTGVAAYVGVVSSYFEQTTRDFERMSDEDWAAQIYSEHSDDVPWMADLVAR